VFVSVADRDKRAIVLPMLRMSQLGFDIVATEGTAEVLARNGIPATTVRKYYMGQTVVEGEPSIVDLINDGKIDIVINTPSGRSARADGFEIRTATVAADKPLFTTIAQVGAAVAAFEVPRGGMSVRSLQDYAADRAARVAKAAG
jgi:carbamoyl-phosphate synthase large subunit